LKKSALIKSDSLIFWGYVLTLLIIAVLPLNSSSSLTLNHTFVIHIRLDHLLHSLLFLPWIIIATRYKQMSLPTAVISGLLIAFMTEGIQFILPYRSYNINDMISNFLGVLAGIIALFFTRLTSTK